MPQLTKKKMISVVSGMICDCCGKTDEQGFNAFAIDYTLGYDSPMDQSSISAAICDTCLLAVVLDKVPGAVFRSNRGVVVPRETAVEALQDYVAHAAKTFNERK